MDFIRADGDNVFSLVACEDDTILGHVMFSRMKAPFKALGLAPVSVMPERQRTGIGADLIAAGLRCAREEGWQGVFVLGEPDYYRRFGFDASLAAGFASPYAGSYLMALALTGSLPALSGDIEYAPAFTRLGS